MSIQHFNGVLIPFCPSTHVQSFNLGKVRFSEMLTIIFRLMPCYKPSVKWFSWRLEAWMALPTDRPCKPFIQVTHENNDKNWQRYNAVCVTDVLCLHCFPLSAKCRWKCMSVKPFLKGINQRRCGSCLLFHSWIWPEYTCRGIVGVVAEGHIYVFVPLLSDWCAA